VVAHFLTVPARADPELEAPARDVVERGDFFAVMIGSRSTTRRTPVPMRRRLIAVAAAAKATNGSRMWPTPHRPP
jgi:hypothetical protein